MNDRKPAVSAQFLADLQVAFEHDIARPLPPQFLSDLDVAYTADAGTIRGEGDPPEGEKDVNKVLELAYGQ